MTDIPGYTAKLIGLMEPVKDKTVPCTDTVTVGRDPKNTLSVVHKSISRNHARIFAESGVWNVEDLNSTNGVFVNGARVTKSKLKDGDALNIGEVQFRFSMLPIQQAAPKPPPDGALFEPTLVGNVGAAMQAAAAQKAPAAGGGGSDALFEPSIVGMNISNVKGAAAAAAPAAAQPKRPAPNMEGMTIVGPDAARALADALQSAKEEAASHKDGGSHSSSKPQGHQPPPVKTTAPNVLVIKLKIAAVFGVILLGVGAAVYALFIIPARIKPMKDAVGAVKRDLEDFVLVAEGKPDTDDPKDLKKELDTLNGIEGKSGDVRKQFADLPQELQDKLSETSDKLAFLVFERKLYTAILEGNKSNAEAVVEDAKKNGPAANREFMTLARMVAGYELFLRKNPDGPDKATQACDRKEAEELYSEKEDVQNEYKKYVMVLPTKGRLFAHLAKEVIDKNIYKVDPWYRLFEDMDRAKGDAAKIDALKKKYPNLKMVQDLK